MFLVAIAIVMAFVVVGLLAPPAHAFSTFTVNSIDDSGDAARSRIEGNFVGTSEDGLRSFTFSPEKAVSVGRTITATATRASTGDTSEFSAPNTVAPS